MSRIMPRSSREMVPIDLPTLQLVRARPPRSRRGSPPSSASPTLPPMLYKKEKVRRRTIGPEVRAELAEQAREAGASEGGSTCPSAGRAWAAGRPPHPSWRALRRRGRRGTGPAASAPSRGRWRTAPPRSSASDGRREPGHRSLPRPGWACAPVLFRPPPARRPCPHARFRGRPGGGPLSLPCVALTG